MIADIRNKMPILLIFVIFIFLKSIGCTKTKTKVATLPDTQFIETVSQKVDETKKLILQTAETQNTLVHAKEIKSQQLTLPRISAIIQPENNSVLSFQMSGLITEIKVKAGDFVKKNQVLASLDHTNETLAVQNSKFDLESKQLLSQQAKNKYSRYFSLFKKKTVSQSAYEEVENEFKLSKLNDNSAAINLKSKEYALQLTQLTAPFDGVITKSYKSLGDFTTIGAAVFDLVQSNDFSVYAQVPVAFLGLIKVGMIFSILNPMNAQKETMTVQKVVPVIDPQSHTFDVYGKINDIKNTFVPGMYVEIILK